MRPSTFVDGDAFTTIFAVAVRVASMRPSTFVDGDSKQVILGKPKQLWLQ